jgi:adenylyl- and sulfurtransferase ThiI
MVVLVRYSEIGIKGKNRARFEQALVANIEACLRGHSVAFNKVRRIYGRILIETDNACNYLRRVFGVASFSQALRAGTTIEETAKIADSLVASLTAADSFRVSCQRLDKNFPLTSQQVCAQLGEKLLTLTKAKVKLQQPTVDIALEILDGAIYILMSRVEGPGGMPVGSQGTALALIEDETSVFAALLVMKRGCTITPVMLNEVDISMLKEFSCGLPMQTERVTAIGELNALVEKHAAQAIVINDYFEHVRQIDLNALVLRPLSGFKGEEVTNARKYFVDLLATN